MEIYIHTYIYELPKKGDSYSLPHLRIEKCSTSVPLLMLGQEKCPQAGLTFAMIGLERSMTHYSPALCPEAYINLHPPLLLKRSAH